MNEEDRYLPAEPAIELLGEKPAKFYYHVDRGEISTETPARPGKGKKNNRYLVSDILQVKKRLQEQRRKKNPPVFIDWIQPQDIPVALKLLQSVYSVEVNLAEAAVYQSWRKNNNLLSLGAFSPDRSVCYASIQLVPLEEHVIMDVLSGKREENSILPDEVQSYNRPGGYTLLATSAVVLKDRPHLLYALLAHYINYWIDQYPERYIRRIYAQAVSESGVMLVQHFFMAPCPNLAYNAFVLDLALPPAARMIRKFKQALSEKAPLPADLQWPPAPLPVTPAIAQPQAPKAPKPVIWEDVNAAQRAKMPTGMETAKATSPPQKTATYPAEPQRSTLPAGYIGFREMARRHGIHENTAKGAIEDGRLPAETGHWVAGRAPVQRAFNREQQDRFVRLFSANEKTREKFHQCDDPQCSCHQTK